MSRMCFSAAGGLLFATVLLSGCGGDSGDTAAEIGGATTPGATATEETSPGGGTTASTTAPSGDAEAGIADAVTALETAAAAVPNGRPFDLERETDQGQQVWDVKAASDGGQVDLDISADGATVITQRQQQTPDDDVQKLQSAQIDAVQALQTAAQQAGGTLSEMEIDTTRDGAVVWQVDLRQSDGTVVEVIVDAATGDIIDQVSGD